MRLFVLSVPLVVAMAVSMPVRAADVQDRPAQIQPAIYYPDNQPVQMRQAGVSVGASVQVFSGGGPYYYAQPPVAVHPRPYYYVPPPVYYYPRVYTYSYPHYYSYPYYRGGLSFGWHGWNRHHGWHGHKWYGGYGHHWRGHGRWHR